MGSLNSIFIQEQGCILKLLSVPSLTGLMVGLLVSASYVPSAQASYICANGPGADEVQVGWTYAPSGGSGSNRFRLCEKNRNGGGSNSGSSAEPRPDPFKGRLEAISAVTSALQGNLAERERIIKSPKYQAYMNGEWEFSGKNGGPCAAIYSRKGEIVVMSGLGGKSKNGSLIFLSSNIPRPASPKIISVTLSQDNYQPQTVKAANHTLTLTNTSLGAIELAIPNLEAGLAGGKSTNRYNLAMDGKSIVNIEFQGGSEVIDRLRKCLSTRANK
ncbi:hypothetical protein [Chamaesiphon minutus]|uniref:Uncharacterized protein n=1 Tax=Chamaesiphon minutus (strain ATCC 27169 / PCC 6605) TaxID=1173020 RepID=K9UKT2_CHAP6|nr:hypothetical protein [Chamaesiphon minutus]AFY95712.1 hypothetical protein Cha6605_4797 [Chamaesiphon minutus PCC 6605]